MYSSLEEAFEFCYRSQESKLYDTKQGELKRVQNFTYHQIGLQNTRKIM